MAAATPLTTPKELEDEFGEVALISWSDHDGDGVADAGVIARWIDRATGEILRTAGQRYSATGLATSDEMRGFATILAGYFGSKSRANPPPDSLTEDVKYIREQLKLLQTGAITLVGVSLKSDLRPMVHNRIIDRRFPWQTVRKRPDSTGPPSKLREHRADTDHTFFPE